MACPYFFPTEKSATIHWPFPRRLPLGAGYCGTCTAGNEPAAPDEGELRDLCNLGYARQCPRIPAERSSDAVRFSIAKDSGDRILVHYCSERNYAPVEHGQLQFSCTTSAWLVPHSNSCIQRQAECYLSTYLERRTKT